MEDTGTARIDYPENYGSQVATVTIDHARRRNAISPGGVETDLMTETGPVAAESMGITYDEFKDNYAQETSIKRLNTVEEVAAVALLLASPEGGGITGADMPVDGGTAL